MTYLGKYDYLPAVNFQTIAFMEKIITSESLVFETGTGNSTIWFARRAKRVVALEHRTGWYEQVRRCLEKEGTKNVKIYLDPEYAQKSFDDILEEKDNIQYDMVLHDGPNPTAERLSLVKLIPSLVKPGGYLIIDDTDRDVLAPGVGYLDSLGWEKTAISGKDFFGQEKEAIIYRSRSIHVKDIPYLSVRALNFLESVIKKSDRILEFGSGGSTIWFAQNAESVVSFEHNPHWYKAVKNRLKELNLNNVDLRLEPNYIWEGYPGTDGMFDFILVDSVAGVSTHESRTLCLKTSYLFLKLDGWLLLDDSKKEVCEEAVKFMGKLGWKAKPIPDSQAAQAWKREKRE